MRSYLIIKDEETWKTVFKTRKGLYEWLVMSFGLCNVPAPFMCVTNDVLCHFLDSFVIIYLGGIIVYCAP